MITNTPIVAGVSSLTIPSHLHTSLKRLAASTHRRGPRGWTRTDATGGHAARREAEIIPADHVSQLALRNLCKVRPGNGRRAVDRAELTDLGREVAAMVSRSRREAGR